ncbi:MAG: DNA topoisomerase 3 [Clostridiales bacterium]|nr:DNA topoisomerase 3 [Clostridiales bacterium]
MSKKLLITEKPSVATSFAKVLGLAISKSDRTLGFCENDKYIITWCFGHLVTMVYPDGYDKRYKFWNIEDLPIIPSEYKYTVIDDDGIRKQFDTITKLFNREDVDVIYVCTDSGREGEYIYRLVYQESKCTKPALRVWISSYTDESILDGLKNAKDISDYNALSDSAYSRAKEDWLFGINFSRLYTCLYGKELSSYLHEEKSSLIAIGRVMTCVLGLVANRENEIKNFVPKTHYEVAAHFHSRTNNVDYTGKWTTKDKNTDDDMPKEIAQKLIDTLSNKIGCVQKITSKKKNELPPLLFNLAELQSEANKKFKIPVDKTLEIAQSLYEKKYITYPRTDSRVITTDIVPTLPEILNGLYKNTHFKEYVAKIKTFGTLKITSKTKRYVDNSKVSDHYAIIPTYVSPDVNRLDENTKKVYCLIVRRFLAMFYPNAIYNTIKVETLIDNELFITNSRTLDTIGWKEVYNMPSKNSKEETLSNLGALTKKEECDVTGFDLLEKQTKPPLRYTDGSLIITMEKAGKFIEDEELREQIKTCGIGTSATRAGIIKKLHNIGYIDINKKTQAVTPTKKGLAIANLVKKTAKELLDPKLTASWEKGLSMIEQSEVSKEEFDNKLKNYVIRTMNKIRET